ncbi:6,7-dimethyl-8-ribityllumazine synthase [Notoacmeibacter ruber]|uniref:6,7-dimethyl-8-ribityllumazine synthase n=1 Tax=Notoacmeibacter ruber TaxID=2670375 RepID=A0A3L7JH34_9HYPH|nr:6,7-dimethyl-8-ribityllumazine synthase [Notoacmeibacter ruber]RLQ89635.1 6,7-dimethyl-8-ribityllumazine synthase [Notoacmeibacter ruber]
MTNPTSASRQIAIIRARWHANIVDRCVDAAKADLEAAGFQVDIYDVPGALEIPLTAKKLAHTGRYAGIIGTAFIVNGGIYRHDFVSATVIDGLMDAQMETGVPVFSTCLTPHNFQEVPPMIEFFEKHFVTKGEEVAEAAIETINLYAQIEAEETAKV